MPVQICEWGGGGSERQISDKMTERAATVVWPRDEAGLGGHGRDQSRIDVAGVDSSRP